MKVNVKNLVPGQEVGIANCGQLAKVIRREGKNLYRVLWCEKELVLPRNQLAVKVWGLFKFGPFNETLS